MCRVWYSPGSLRDAYARAECQLFFVHIPIKNISDTDTFFPERGGDIQLEFKPEGASNEVPTQPFEVGGETLTLYSDSAEEQGADTGAYPDTVRGVMSEIPERFERSDAFVIIRCSDTSADSRTVRRQLD